MSDSLTKELELLREENRKLKKQILRFRSLYTNTTIGVYRTTPDGKIEFANQPLVEMLGFKSLEELKKYNLERGNLISTDQRKEFKKLIDKNGVIIGHEAIWKKKDGSPIHVRESAKAIKDENGKIIFYEGTIEDITSQKLKENQLIESEERYRKLMEALPYAAAVHKDYKIHYLNSQAIRLLKFENIDYIGRSIFDFIHPKYHPIATNRIKTVLNKEKNVELIEQTFLTSKGDEFPVEVSSLPVIINNEKYTLSVFSDITEQKKAEQELHLSEITFHGLLNNISEGIFILDLNFKVIEINQTVTKLFDKEYESFIGKDFFKFFRINEKNYNKIIKKLKDLKKNNPEIYQLSCIKNNDKDFQGEVSFLKGIYYDKQVIIAVIKDITEFVKSETRYKDLFEFAVGGILIGTTDGYIIDANNHMCKIFGRKKEDIIGKHLSDNFFTKDSVETIPLEFERLWQGETIVKQRTVKRPDGSTIEIEMHTKMFPDGTLQSFFHDITDKKQAEKQILEEKTKALLNYANLQAVIENTTDNIWAIDTQYRILYLNKNFKTNFKEVFETDLYLGVNILDCLEKSYSEFWKEKYDLVINNNQRLQFEQEIPLKENFIFISVSLNPILKDNKVIGVACFGSDITKRKNEEKELIKALNRAEESEKLKSAFLANMSHEIRTPINGILGFLDLLRDDISNEEKNEYINIIENSTRQLLDTLTDIIELSKIEAGIVKINREPIEFSEIIFEVVTQMQGYIPRNKNIKLYFKNVFNQQVFGDTDHIKLRQILINLISNAVKFTEEGFIEVKLTKISPTHIEISVKDTGIGIKPEYIEKIFDRFSHFEISNKSFHKSSGLGLSICKAYSEMLGGKISVESEYGKGSTFILTIPIYLSSNIYN